MSDDYKFLHETFVSNHNGTTSWEVCAATLPAFLSTFIIQVLLPWIPGAGFKSSTVLGDFAIAVIPQIAVLTIASQHIYHIITLQIFILSIVICFRYWNGHTGGNKSEKGGGKKIKQWKQLAFVSHFRATLLLVTVISILAVDFPVFPRRFAKTEISGYGLMDIGVGMFVVSNGIVASHARQSDKKTHWLRTIWGEFKGSLLMMVAALVRLLSTRSVDYHQHNSEYGVHWNFFCTLALVKIGSACILAVVPRKFSLTLSLICVAVYQYMLEFQGLRHYLLNDTSDQVDSNDFVYLNRGGLFSCFGYLAIYFASVHIGMNLFKPRTNLKEWIKFDIQLFVVSILLWLTLSLCHQYVDLVSRRIANLTYVVWVIMHGTQHLALLLAADITASYLNPVNLGKRKGKGKLGTLTMNPCSSILLQAINKNGFFYFILANLATGIVNMSMQTIFASTLQSTVILFVYTVLLNVAVIICLIKDKVFLRL